MAKLLQGLGVLILVGLVAFLVGPRPALDTTVTFDAGSLPANLDSWLSEREAEVANLRPGLAKGIDWHDPAKREKTPISIVYLHGFSASRAELDPVPAMIARSVGANLFHARLTGHGRDGQGLAEASVNDWFNDTAEAIAIGERIGERVVLLSASTGGTLSTWAAGRPDLSGKIAGLAMISPNFGVKGASTGLLNMPWAETLLPLVFGAERSWEPHNEMQAAGWTTSYPSSAIFPMAALLRHVTARGYRQITTPALIIFSPADMVVDSALTRDVASNWGGPVETMIIDESSDPSMHVIAGNTLSPENNERVAERISGWIMALPQQ